MKDPPVLHVKTHEDQIVPHWVLIIVTVKRTRRLIIIKTVRFCGCPGTSNLWAHRLRGDRFKFILPYKGVTYRWEVLCTCNILLMQGVGQGAR